jgi:septal ring factor EnvC (AmiA/AmiB activator)|tara:strand:- start:1026 stop:1343 length:318 start_codon:yes stop_codon:yes gene_type:complete
MEFLRKSWKWVLGFIGFFVGLVWMMNSNSSRKVKKIKKNIRSNENKTSEVDGKIKYIKKKKKVTKKKISDTNQELKNIKKKKPKVKKRTGKQAKTSIKNRLKKNN